MLQFSDGSLEGSSKRGFGGFHAVGFGRLWRFSTDALLLGWDLSQSSSLPLFMSEVTKRSCCRDKNNFHENLRFLGRHTRRVSWQYHGEEE